MLVPDEGKSVGNRTDVGNFALLMQVFMMM